MLNRFGIDIQKQAGEDNGGSMTIIIPRNPNIGHRLLAKAIELSHRRDMAYDVVEIKRKTDTTTPKVN